MEKIIDLHIHTNCSDGKYSPIEIIDKAILNDVEIIAISDHDSVDVYCKELFDYAKKKNIRIIPAIEISTKWDKCGIHVLDYNIDYNDSEFRKKILFSRNSRYDYLKGVTKKLRELGYVVNLEELEKIDSVTKSHIASDVVNNEANKSLLENTFGYVPLKGEFIEEIMNEGCPAYVEKVSYTPSQAAEIIRKAGGKVILAHPVAYIYEDNLTDEDILKIVKEMSADGIEANYVYIDKNGIKHNDIKHWNKFAVDNNLITTIGSDFHNEERDNTVVIGLINEDLKYKIESNETIIENLV